MITPSQQYGLTVKQIKNALSRKSWVVGVLLIKRGNDGEQGEGLKRTVSGAV